MPRASGCSTRSKPRRRRCPGCLQWTLRKTLCPDCAVLVPFSRENRRSELPPAYHAAWERRLGILTTLAEYELPLFVRTIVEVDVNIWKKWINAVVEEAIVRNRFRHLEAQDEELSRLQQRILDRERLLQGEDKT